MVEPRISNILIGLLLTSLIAVGFSGFFADGIQKYPNANDYNNTSMVKFTNLTTQLEIQINNTNDALNSVGSGSTSLFDIFGSFFASSWSAIKTTSASIGLFQSIITLGVTSLPFAETAFFSFLIRSLMLKVIIIIVIGILFHFLIKSNRL